MSFPIVLTRRRLSIKLLYKQNEKKKTFGMENISLIGFVNNLTFNDDVRRWGLGG